MPIDATTIASMTAAMRSNFPGTAQSIKVDGAWIDATITRVAAGSIPTDYGIVEGKASTARVTHADLAAGNRATWIPKTGDIVETRDTRGNVTEYRIGLVANHEYHYNLTLSDKVSG